MEQPAKVEYATPQADQQASHALRSVLAVFVIVYAGLMLTMMAMNWQTLLQRSSTRTPVWVAYLLAPARFAAVAALLCGGGMMSRGRRSGRVVIGVSALALVGLALLTEMADALDPTYVRFYLSRPVNALWRMGVVLTTLSTPVLIGLLTLPSLWPTGEGGRRNGDER